MTPAADQRLTEAAYHAAPGGPLSTPSFYLQDVPKLARTPVTSFAVPIRSGQAWHVAAGQICRLSLPDGPQVGDLNLWSAHNPRERMWAARTRQLQAAHVSLGDRLWSNLPYLRPLCTIVGDSLADYGKDGNGGRVHDLLGTRCGERTLFPLIDLYWKRLRVLTATYVDPQTHTSIGS
jgi:uncharacterized protein